MVSENSFGDCSKVEHWSHYRSLCLDYPSYAFMRPFAQNSKWYPLNIFPTLCVQHCHLRKTNVKFDEFEFIAHSSTIFFAELKCTHYAEFGWKRLSTFIYLIICFILLLIGALWISPSPRNIIAIAEQVGNTLPPYYWYSTTKNARNSFIYNFCIVYKVHINFLNFNKLHGNDQSHWLCF